MNSTIIAALIGFAGVIITAIFTPGSVLLDLLKRSPKLHNIKGAWLSFWGPTQSSKNKYSEDIIITNQKGLEIKGSAVQHNSPGKKWELRGRYDGQFLQMYYYPSKESKNIDFLDYGCYFLKRMADGSFEGYSTGFGLDEGGMSESTTIDHHSLKRK